MEELSDVRFKQRSVIEFLNAEVPPIENHRRMQAVYGDQSVDVTTLRRWVRRFKDGEMGQTDLSDKTRSGRPVTASDQLHQYRVEELIRGNRRIKQKEIAVALGTHYWCSWIPKSLCQMCTTPGLTQVKHQEMQFNAWTFQCCRIHRRAQIWLQVISTCSQN